MPTRETFANLIQSAQAKAMRDDPKMLCFGLGVDDPKRIFGTTHGLIEEFGPQRVFDMPTSENGMTGVGIGAALSGSRVLMTHQRVDFFLLAMDQLVNNAAKWHYMFNGQMNVPLTIRLIIGRGWGQGPTHAQNLHAWFAHIPGLKVVMPSTPGDANQLLYDSIMDNNPVVFLEHRWLHNQVSSELSVDEPRLPMSKAKVLQDGRDITIVGMSYLTLEALNACKVMSDNGLSPELIDLRSISPIDWGTIEASVKKTGRLLVLDSGSGTGSFASEIIATMSMRCFQYLKTAPVRMALPDIPEPTSYGLTKTYYNDAQDIAVAAHRIVTGDKREALYKELMVQGHHDVPGDHFKGPF